MTRLSASRSALLIAASLAVPSVGSAQRIYWGDSVPPRAGYDMTTLDRSFAAQQREFPAGSFLVDMAQPMASAAFYYLEPQASDGFVGWGVLDGALRAGAEYPVFKYRREIR